MWDFKIFQGSLTNGVLATGGNVVFAAIARRQHRRARREDRQAPVALPDRRDNGGVAHELRGQRPAVRRARRRQHGLRFALPGDHAVISTALVAISCLSLARRPIRHRRSRYTARQQRRHRPAARTPRRQTVVSIVPSVGNIAFEMKVKGQNVLRWPYASVEEFKARPGAERHSVSRAVGEPARRAGVLRQRQAVRVRHGARQRSRRDSHPRISDGDRSVAGDRSRRPTASRHGSRAGSSSTAADCG